MGFEPGPHRTLGTDSFSAMLAYRAERHNAQRCENPRVASSDQTTVAIIGAGSIGIGWSIVFARAGQRVAVTDSDSARLAALADEVGSRLADLRQFDLLEDEPDAVLRRITVEDRVEAAVAHAVHIQECVPEDLPLKRELFRLLDALAPAEAVIASSSSALTASAIAGDLGGRHRCLVAHPGNPPYLLPIVEIVPAPFTTVAALSTTRHLLERCAMSVVVLRKEIDGFVFNRLQGAVLREAWRLVRDGVVTVQDIDRTMRDGPGRRWALIGPFEVSDLNARGGIEAHARRMGPAYDRMGQERGEDAVWTPELVERVVAQQRAALPLDRWEARVRWRDRAMMALERARRSLTPIQ